MSLGNAGDTIVSWGYQGHHEQQAAAIIGARLGYASLEISTVLFIMYRAGQLQPRLNRRNLASGSRNTLVLSPLFSARPEKWTKKPPWVCMAELDWRVSVTRPLCRAVSGAFGCSAPILHLNSVGELKQIPPSVVSWSPTAACPSTSIRFLLPWILPNHHSGEKILHYRADRARKWSLLSVHDTFIVQ